MSTKEELLLNQIKIPEEDNKTEMALPPEVKATNKLKKHGLFSMPLFKESLHSNRSVLLIVSIGNALIMVIIIGILSTLKINSTADALKNLFDNADMESTIKSGAVSLYTAYNETANAYQSFADNSGQVQSLVTTAVDEVNDEKLNSGIRTAKRGYDLSYALASLDASTDEEKQKAHASAKSTTMKLVQNTLDQDTSLSDSEKKVAENIISMYLDYYFLDKSASTESIL